MTSPARFRLPVATYEYLRAQAGQWGGVGWGMYYRPLPRPEGALKDEPRVFEPCCIHGLTDATVRSISGRRASRYTGGIGREFDVHERALRAIGLYPAVSDTAFSVQERKDPWFRLPFDEWARRLGVVPV